MPAGMGLHGLLRYMKGTEDFASKNVLSDLYIFKIEF